MKTAFVVLALFVGTAAQAAPKTYVFEGVIDNAFQLSSPIPQWQFAVGQTFRGSVVYDASLISSSNNIVSDPNWTLTRHNSPLVALNFSIDAPGGTYAYDVPTLNLTGTAFQSASVGAGAGGFDGIDMSWQNYPIGWTSNPPSVFVPPSAYIGPYSPHSAFLSLFDVNNSFSLPDTSADLDLVSLFNQIGPNGVRSLTIRYSDSFAWTPGVERIDAIVGGRIERFALLSAVPEPGSWALMIFGFGMIGAALRTRRARLVPEFS